MKIAFCWQGINGRYGHWNDGLKKAMELIETEHDVTYHEPQDNIKDVDIILYWEAPCTILGKDKMNYLNVLTNPIPKALLFAGGPIKKEWVDGFDLLFVESQINADECEQFGIPYRTAFGVNTDIFYPQKLEKKWDAYMPATCASWKRQGLFSQSVKEKGILSGRDQPTDPQPFIDARKNGTTVLDEQPYEQVARLLNESYVMLQTSEFWGGGQRATLEAMACGIPPIVMSDSPKNREYVEESGFGLVIEPREEDIRVAVRQLKVEPQDVLIGVRYIESKFTAAHYAMSLLQGIKQILQ